MEKCAVAEKLIIPDDVVGRDVEIEQIRHCYRVSRGDAPASHEQPQTPPGPATTTSVHTNKSAPASRSVYVRGLSGTGKTRLVMKALEDVIDSDGGYFCTGKFASVRSHLPFEAIVDAINSLCAQVHQRCLEEIQTRGNSKVVEKEHHESSRNKRRSFVKSLSTPRDHNVSEARRPSLEKIRAKLEAGLNVDDIQLLASLFSNLSLILLPTTAADKSAKSRESVFTARADYGIKMLRRIKSSLRILMESLVDNNKMLVMFLDDLQWAKADVLDVIQDLAMNLSHTRFLFVGGFRSNEVGQDSILMSHIRDHPHLLLDVWNLSLQDVTTFVVTTLKRPVQEVTDLAHLIHERTEGNVFFVRQYLDFLYRNGHIYHSIQNFRWEWDDVSTIQDDMETHVDVEEVICKKIMTLDRATIDALKLASLLGSRFSLDVLDHVVGCWWKDQVMDCQSETFNVPVEEVLWSAVEEGLIEEMTVDPFASSVTYKFVHDKVQSAAYSLIGKGRKIYHLRVGRYLHQLYDRNHAEESWMVVLAANHYYKGEVLVSVQQDRDVMAMVCLEAASALSRKLAFLSAIVFCKNCLVLLGINPWKRSYELSLKVNNLLVEMEFCIGHKDECDRYFKTIISKARTTEDKIHAYLVQMKNVGNVGRYQEACDVGLELIRRLNLTRVPRRITAIHMLAETLRASKALQRYTEQELKDFEHTEDESVMIYCRVMTEVALYAFFANDKILYLFIINRSMRVALQYGYTGAAPMSIVGCALISAAMNQLEEAKRLGRVAVYATRLFPAVETMPASMMFVYYHMIFWLDNPVQEADQKFLVLYKSASSSCGSLDVAYLNLSSAIYFQFYIGVRLDKVAAASADACSEMQFLKKEMLLPSVRCARQVVLNLLRTSDRPSLLQGDEIIDIKSLENSLTGPNLRLKKFFSLMLAAWFGEWGEALHHAKQTARRAYEDRPLYYAEICRFWRCMVWTHMYAKRADRNLRRLVKKEASFIQGRLDEGVQNYDTFMAIIKAEMMACGMVKASTIDEVKTAFDNAISIAEGHEYGHYAALAREYAGEFLLCTEDEDLGRTYLQEALNGYKEWRALGKVWDMRKKHGFLREEGPPF